MKAVRIFSRLFLGTLFIFSGFVKALDPLGSAYKFGDYFEAFGLQFLDSISLVLGVFLAAFEFVLGLVLILGYQKRNTYWILLFFMGFFTVLTFILALTNPVTDCGCFGDAIILTNWQTFFKNLVFMVFVLILFRSRNLVGNVHSQFLERSIIVLLFAASFILSSFCLKHLPLIDFRPYDIGTSIAEDMEIPEGAPRDEYLTILIYENRETGDTEEFTIDNYPNDTTKYRFITSDPKLISKGYEPPIHDFGVVDPEGYEVTDELLDFKGYTLFMTIPDIEKAEKTVLGQFNDWDKLQRLSEGFMFVPLTASTTSTIEKYTGELGLEYDFYSGDEIMLKTMVRSSPGFFLLKNGTIIAKWSWKDFPQLSEWNEEWPETIQQYTSEQDPEIQFLIDEGLMEEISTNIIDFDYSANKLVFEKNVLSSDRFVWGTYILVVLLTLIMLQFIPTKKERRG